MQDGFVLPYFGPGGKAGPSLTAHALYIKEEDIRPKEFAMPLSEAEGRLRDHFLHKLLDAVLPFHQGPDPEVNLEALIEATGLLQEHLQRELAALRQEQAE